MDCTTQLSLSGCRQQTYPQPSTSEVRMEAWGWRHAPSTCLWTAPFRPPYSYAPLPASLHRVSHGLAAEPNPHGHPRASTQASFLPFSFCRGQACDLAFASSALFCHRRFTQSSACLTALTSASPELTQLAALGRLNSGRLDLGCVLKWRDSSERYGDGRCITSLRSHFGKIFECSKKGTF